MEASQLQRRHNPLQCRITGTQSRSDLGGMTLLQDLDPQIAVMAALRRLNRFLRLIKFITLEYDSLRFSKIILASLQQKITADEPIPPVMDITRGVNDPYSISSIMDSILHKKGYLLM